MPVIVSGGETHTIELDPDGSVTSQLNLMIGLPSIIQEDIAPDILEICD